MKFLPACAFALAVSFAVCVAAHADPRPDSHAPIGVMGDHVHRQGEWMFSYRYMHMSMRDNRDGTDDLRPAEIVSTAANPFALAPPRAREPAPMMPPTLRVVPLNMTMSMHMFGAMYAPSDRVTLMGMAHHTRKEMDHVTYAGPTGTTALGRFTTETSGLGDISLAALIAIGASGHWHGTLGVSIPTGDIEKRDQILTPMNTRPNPRLPYPMQLGSGSFDLILGLTHSDGTGKWGWGGQWRSVVRGDDNDEDYRLGDEHTVQGWASYLLTPRTSLSARLSVFERGNIDGRDPAIRAPVQTADPDRHAATRADAALGVNVVLPGGRNRIALEWLQPLYQDLEGPQLKNDWTITLGWQFTR
ncbi:MAG: transporter [Pseudomonadota bacterium]